MRIFIRSTLRAVLVLGGLIDGVGAVAGAQQGTVAGRVTDQANGQPLVGARVTIMGTSLIAQTNAEGRYTLPRVPGGQLTVRATAVGFGAASRAVTVNPGETAAVDLALGAVAVLRRRGGDHGHGRSSQEGSRQLDRPDRCCQAG